MNWLKAAVSIGCLAVAACGANEQPKKDIRTVKVTVSLPDDAIIEDTDTAITKEAVDKVARLLQITASGRLTPLVREAERNANFQSNFGDRSHSRYWFLLRRVGVDPVQTLRETLDQPYGVKQVGNEHWFIWPDFAALAPEDLIPEVLSFQDRARLRELIGEDGIESIRAGNPYPGVRIAVSDTGRWVYFIHDIDTTEVD